MYTIFICYLRSGIFEPSYLLHSVVKYYEMAGRAFVVTKEVSYHSNRDNLTVWAW